jgi:S-DNA-T family DNA segregation ATPase FtsK/SpoIIIE
MIKKKTNGTKSKKSEGFRNFIEFFKNENNQKIFGFLFLLFSFYFFIAFTSFFFNWKEDYDVVKNTSWISVLMDTDLITQNSLGKFGALFSYLFVSVCFGISAYFIPVFLFFSGMRLLGYYLINLKKYIRQSIWGLIWIPIFISHFFGSDIFAGGIGFNSSVFLNSLLGSIGTTLLIITTFLIFITLKFNITAKVIINFIQSLKPKKGVERTIDEIEDLFDIGDNVND